MVEVENWQTKVNYSPELRGLLAASVFGLLALVFQTVERGPMVTALPKMLQGRMFDTFAIPVLAEFTRITGVENKYCLGGVAAGLCIFDEIGQKHGYVAEGTYDTGDFGAFAIGGILWLLFENQAKKMHDSGMTMPIYRFLGIQHRKTQDETSEVVFE